MKFDRKVKSLKLECQKQRQKTNLSSKDIKTTDPERELQLLLMQKIEIYIEKLSNLEFFRAFMDQINTPEASHHFHKLRGSQDKIKMVIYGIGSIESDKPPRWQLSLAVLMKRNLDWIGDVEVFDPVFSSTESKVMEEFGFRVLSVNEKCRRQAVDPILFFMPCVDVRLYNNLLEANWRRDMLNRIVLLGNSIEEVYQERPVKIHILDHLKHLLAIRPFTKEFRIPMASNDFSRALGGFSWHFFNVDHDWNLQLTF